MNQEFRSISFGRHRKSKLLEIIYSIYADWNRCFSLACRKGCSACCTQSVTMTSLEGEIMLDFIRKSGRESELMDKIAGMEKGRCSFSMTTNQFAEACLNQQEISGNESGCWDYTPCVFLENNTCLIYEVRPFGCRSFGSLVKCGPETAAEIYPIHLSVNTVFSQIIEHLCSEYRGYWSSMADILYSLIKSTDRTNKQNLLRARPVPGLLLETEEKAEIRALLKKLKAQIVDREGLGDLIDNLLLI